MAPFIYFINTIRGFIKMSKDDLQKWMEASVKATELKFALENILNNDFSEEEKESVKYRQLLDTVDQYLEHVMSKYRQEKIDRLRADDSIVIEKLRKENEKLKKENNNLLKGKSLFSIKNISLTTLGAILIEIIRLIIVAIRGY